jgi:hypothetical protein
MPDRDGRRRIGSNHGWLIAAGGGLAAVLSAGWAIRKVRRQPETPVGAHAWVVPMGQARMEARWTRQANAHSSESKG